MPLFLCQGCGCVENTALCNYWVRRNERRLLLCSACDPDIQLWHDTFTRVDAKAAGYQQDQLGHLWAPSTIRQGTVPPDRILKDIP